MCKWLAIDSNALTYFLDAMHGEEDLSTVAPERQAMVRFYFYTDYSFWVSPTVKTEYLRIHDSAKKKEHHDWSQFHFEDVWPATPSDVIAQSVSKLMVHHPRHRDCQIVAEAESLGAEFGVETLLSCDIEMIGRLNGRCRLEILRLSVSNS